MRPLEKFKKKNVKEILYRKNVEEMRSFIDDLYYEYCFFLDDNARYIAIFSGVHQKSEKYLNEAFRLAVKKKFKILNK